MKKSLQEVEDGILQSWGWKKEAEPDPLWNNGFVAVPKRSILPGLIGWFHLINQLKHPEKKTRSNVELTDEQWVDMHSIRARFRATFTEYPDIQVRSGEGETPEEAVIRLYHDALLAGWIHKKN